ncbi:hypothetical protein Q3C01_17605 [Bradyrhizobium sp. UFLA05-109]
MLLLRLVVAAWGGFLFAAAPIMAQNYPSRPITLIVPFPAGGPTDVVGRTIA